MKTKMTHTGNLVGCDVRMPTDYRRRISLRETANFWITEHGTKYRKTTGYRTGDDGFSLYRLDLDSVEPIDEGDA